jgi:hypothetical protein
VSVFALWFGVPDAMSAATLHYKLIGFGFTLAGLTLLIGAVVTVWPDWHKRHGRIAAVAAGVAGVLIGVYLLQLQYQAPELPGDGFLVFPAWTPWAGIVAASVAGSLLVWWSTREHVGTQRTGGKLGLSLASLGAIVTLIFGGVQWWYTEQYEPGTVGAALTVTTELKQVSPASEGAAAGEVPGPRLFEGRVVIRNESPTKVQIMSSLYVATQVLYGSRQLLDGINEVDRQRLAASCFFEELAPVSDPECDRSPNVRRYGDFHAEDPNAQDDWAADRNSEVLAVQALEIGPVTPDGMWLQPHEQTDKNLLIPVPEPPPPNDEQIPSLETLDLTATLAVAKGERLVLEPAGGHGPEMVPRTAMGVEEYRDYKLADGEKPAEEVSSDDRAAYFRDLIERQAADVPTPSPINPRTYPERITITRALIKPLSSINELVSGIQAINTVQVLTDRKYDPFGPLTESEDPYLVVCTAPAEKHETAKDLEEIRSDPTLACPGVWFDFRNEGRKLDKWERQYQELINYREGMDEFYGLVFTGASDVVSLTNADQLPDQNREASATQHPLYNLSEPFRACAPVLDVADDATALGDGVQQAFDRHASEMGVPTGREIVDEAPSLADGAMTAAYLDQYGGQVQDLLHRCGSDGPLASDVTADSGADYCIRAADAELEALRHAHDLGVAVQQHQIIMQQYEDGAITARQRDAMGAPSLEQGAAAADAFRQSEDEADGLMASCS